LIRGYDKCAGIHNAFLDPNSTEGYGVSAPFLFWESEGAGLWNDSANQPSAHQNDAARSAQASSRTSEKLQRETRLPPDAELHHGCVIKNAASAVTAQWLVCAKDLNSDI
jgi:hypothetical protein